MSEPVIDYEEAVLEVVRLIPSGHVLSYGDIAEILDHGGPRQVGAVMAGCGADVAWWRVIRAGGEPPHGLARQAALHYEAEGTPLRRTSGPAHHDDGATARVDMAQARWVPQPADQLKLEEVYLRLRQSADGMSEPDDGLHS